MYIACVYDIKDMDFVMAFQRVHEGPRPLGWSFMQEGLRTPDVCWWIPGVDGFSFRNCIVGYILHACYRPRLGPSIRYSALGNFHCATEIYCENIVP